MDPLLETNKPADRKTEGVTKKQKRSPREKETERKRDKQKDVVEFEKTSHFMIILFVLFQEIATTNARVETSL